MLQDDPALRDDSVVSRGRVGAADPFAGGDRGRFRSSQRDARFRLQPRPRPIGECHVPTPLPDPDDPAGAPPLRRPRRGPWRKPTAKRPAKRGKAPGASLYIMSESSPEDVFPRPRARSVALVHAPRRDYTCMCVSFSSNACEYCDETRTRTEVTLTRLQRADYYGL